MNTLTTLAQYYNTYNTGYDYSYTTGDAAVAAGVSMAFMGFFLIFGLIAYAVTAFLLSRIFKKAGVEGWKAWIPVYNSWTLLELGGQQGFWAILAFIPVVNIVSVVFMYIAMYNIGLKLGKEGAFILLAIFLPIVWLAWLAFDKSTWKGASAMKAKTAK